MRTKEFDKDKVLTKAVYTFWSQGYANTSIQNLVDEMGINRRSMYDTFGDKHQIFLLSLQQYSELITLKIKEELADKTTLSTKISAIFNIYLQHSPSRPQGCLLVNSATELAMLDKDVNKIVNKYFQSEINFLEKILIEFQSDLMPNTDISELAISLQNELVGIRVLTKVNPKSKQLDSVVNHTLKSLPWR